MLQHSFLLGEPQPDTDGLSCIESRASTRAVREDTSFLRQESSQIKQDTAAICTQLDAVRDGNLQIMDQIRQLRRHSPAGDGMEDNQDCWRPTAITPDGVAQILEEIARLRELLPSNVTMNASKHEGLDSATSFILERYLESASLYAETIREDGNSDRGLPMRVYPSQDEVAVGTPVIGTAECQQQGENVVSPTPSLTTSVQPAESLPRLVFAKRTNGKPFFTNRIGNDGWAVAIAEFMKEPPTTTLRFYGLEGDGQMPKGATRPKWQSPLVFRFVNVSRHGERVAFWTRGKNSACRVLDRVSGKCISLELSDKLGRGIPEIPEWFVSCPTFSPDGKMIAAFLTDTRSSPASDWILIWTIDDTAFNLGAVTQTAAIRIYLPDSILSDDHLAISPDGQRVVMHRRYSRQHKFHTKFHIWDIYSGGYGQRRCQTIDMGSLWHQFGKHPVFSATDSRDWMAVTWNPLTQELSFCNLSMGSTFTWSVPLTRQAPTTPTRPDVEKGTCVDSVSHQQVALAYDGNSNCFLVAVVVAKPDDRYGSQQGIRVWNLTRSELVCEVKIPPRSVALRPDLSDDGKFLAATIFDKEGPRHGEGRVIAWKIQ